MKINFMLVIIAVAFSTVAGVLGAEYYTTITAMQHGLHQCQVWNDTHSHYDVMWQEKCSD